MSRQELAKRAATIGKQFYGCTDCEPSEYLRYQGYQTFDTDHATESGARAAVVANQAIIGAVAGSV